MLRDQRLSFLLYEGVFREMSLYEELLEFQGGAAAGPVRAAATKCDCDDVNCNRTTAPGGRPRRHVREKDDA